MARRIIPSFFRPVVLAHTSPVCHPSQATYALRVVSHPSPAMATPDGNIAATLMPSVAAPITATPSHGANSRRPPSTRSTSLRTIPSSPRTRYVACTPRISRGSSCLPSTAAIIAGAREGSGMSRASRGEVMAAKPSRAGRVTTRSGCLLPHPPPRSQSYHTGHRSSKRRHRGTFPPGSHAGLIPRAIR